MKTRLVLVLALAFAARPVAVSSGNADLLSRMAALNAGLRTFTATLNADVTLRSFPFLSVKLVGTYYFEQPDKTKVVFTGGVPLIASQFDKLYAHIESPSQWPAVYHITRLSDDGTTTTFRLVPRKRGNVDHVDATVDDATAAVATMRWNYANGGYAEMRNHYRRIGGYLLVTSQSGHVKEPGYDADITSTIGGYTLNPKLDDRLFDAQGTSPGT